MHQHFLPFIYLHTLGLFHTVHAVKLTLAPHGTLSKRVKHHRVPPPPPPPPPNQWWKLSWRRSFVHFLVQSFLTIHSDKQVHTCCTHTLSSCDGCVDSQKNKKIKNVTEKKLPPGYSVWILNWDCEAENKDNFQNQKWWTCGLRSQIHTPITQTHVDTVEGSREL